MQSVLVIIGIVILSALVAAGGDRIGRLAAKRRLHFLGFRPRLSATIIAVLTGIVIALGTTFLLSLASVRVREMLFHFDELKASLTNLEGKLKVLEREVKNLEIQRKGLGNDLARARQTLKERETKISTLSRLISESGASLRRLKLELTKASSQLRDSQERLRLTEAKLSKAREELGSAQKANETLKAEGERLRAENANLEERREELIRVAREMEQKTEALREEQVAVEVNEPLAYIRVPSSANLPQVWEIISSSLSRLSAQLEARGLSLKDVSHEELSELVDTLSILGQDAILIIYSAKNFVAGEAVEVTFELALDKLVFKKGETIASLRIGAEEKERELRFLLPRLLRIVRGVAISRGLLPNLETGEVGTLSSEDVETLKGLLAKNRGPFRLLVLAGKDVYTTDKLDSFAFKIASP